MKGISTVNLVKDETVKNPVGLKQGYGSYSQTVVEVLCVLPLQTVTLYYQGLGTLRFTREHVCRHEQTSVNM